MIDKLDKFHLTYIPTFELKKLRSEITHELAARRAALKIKARFADYVEPEPYEPIVYMTKPEVEEYNASGLYSVPNHYARKINNVAIYLPALLKQDWSHLYNGGDQSNNYYVYAHINPIKKHFATSPEAGGDYGGMPFYIGKGTGNRAYDLSRNQGHGKIINLIRSSGFKDHQIPRILFDKIPESKAYELEAKLIYFFGTIYDKLTKKSGILYNLDTPKVPEFVGSMMDYKNKNPSGISKTPFLAGA